VFNEKRSAADARNYRRKGLDVDSRRIVDFLVARGIGGGTLLEIGGGVGAIQIELLRAGAVRAENVEIVPAYEAVARDLASENGVADRITRRVGDFAVDHADVPGADAVILHRVVCCYPDMAGLVHPAADRAGRWLVLTFPAARWWIRAGLRVMNGIQVLIHSSYCAYVHDPAAIDAIVRSSGVRPTVSRRGFIGELLALERV
jgi:magnesium-protoporphyrin O-methyltransferase